MKKINKGFLLKSRNIMIIAVYFVIFAELYYSGFFFVKSNKPEHAIIKLFSKALYLDDSGGFRKDLSSGIEKIIVLGLSKNEALFLLGNAGFTIKNDIKEKNSKNSLDVNKYYATKKSALIMILFSSDYHIYLSTKEGKVISVEAYVISTSI